MIKAIYYSSKFEKNYEKLPKNIRAKAVKMEKVFRKDPLTPSLKTHGLKGKLSGYFAFSVDRSYRIMFVWEDSSTVTFIDIGTHGIYE